jgi:glycosidase
VLEYAAGGKASELYRNIELMREAYPPQAFYALMNLLSTHDQARSLHYLGWQTDDANTSVIQRAKQRLKLAIFFQMTFPGAPAVYYGDEVGVTGGDDPYNRAPYPWADSGGRPDTELLAEVKRLIKLRSDNPVLRRGSIGAPLLLDEHVVVLGRQLDDKVAISATNNAEQPRTVTIELPENFKVTSFTDATTGASIQAIKGKLTFNIPALFGTLLLSP